MTLLVVWMAASAAGERIHVYVADQPDCCQHQSMLSVSLRPARILCVDLAVCAQLAQPRQPYVLRMHQEIKQEWHGP